MKLNQYKEKKNSRKILIIIGAILLFVGGIIVEKTFANFKESKSFKVMEGNFIYEGSGDVIFAFYKGDESLTQMPKKVNEEKLTFVKGECDKGASIKWDYNNWQPTVVNLQESKTTCKLYFGQEYDTICNSAGVDSGACYLAKKVGSDSSIIYDNTIDNNVRFIGSNPNNYVTFNNELWRIIGVMNNIEDESGNIKSHIKIVSYNIIGSYSWDTSERTINHGYGVNEWSTSDIQDVLNNNYYKKEAGGVCYNNDENVIAECPKWESIGLDDNARSMVSKVKWHTGTMPVRFDENQNINSELISPSYMYEAERSENNGKLCNSSEYCRDEVERTTSWTGYVGLIYPSDFGYSTNGENELKRQTCIKTSMYRWPDIGIKCLQNSWLATNNSNDRTWTMTPVPDSMHATMAFYIVTNKVITSRVSSKAYINPVVYLDSNVKLSGEGTASSPYKLSLN